MESISIIRKALETALSRIEVEDYQGTCGCDQRRTGKCGCLQEHDLIIAEIQAGLDAVYALDINTPPS